MKSPNNPSSVVCVDMGTTNTRVWLTRGQEIVGKAEAQVGVRDTAREGSSNKIRQELHRLIATVVDHSDASPSCVIGAGMITSALGLMEIPHVPAPAGVQEFASATRRCEFHDVTDLPIFLVPGVRSGPMQCTPATAAQSDIMRGEETLCIGAASLGLIHPPAVVLNLGSHWKTIQIDAQNRISGSCTSLAGEMIHAVQTTTILASSLPKERPTHFETEWVHAGMREQRNQGLARALFCVRLMEQLAGGQTSPIARASFLAGGFIASELDSLLKTGRLTPGTPILIVGHAAMADAWRDALETAGLKAAILNDTDTERAFLRGLSDIGSQIS